jgi:hypothetical protein
VLKIDLLDTCLFIPAYKAGLSRQDSGNEHYQLLRTEDRFLSRFHHRRLSSRCRWDVPKKFHGRLCRGVLIS